jgi:pyruvate kinase
MTDIIFNRTKIIATVGPTSDTREKLKALIKAGVDVFRLNFSHGDHDDKLRIIEMIRSLNEEMRTNISILQDLQGPKIRLNEVEADTFIQEGERFVVKVDGSLGNSESASTTYSRLPKDVKAGDSILIDDGKIELQVEATTNDEVITKVVHGGPLLSRKGMNLPNTDVSAPSLTEKDIADLKFGLDNDVDWIALSFVRKSQDITELRSRIEASGKQVHIIAKIEKPEAVENIDEIIAETDAIMVARGDLGVEIEMEEVPLVQKMIVDKCNLAAKPVIVATQMLESMITNPRPTRAETSDVANSVMDGADTVMLSAETAAGQYPVLAVKSMVKTIRFVENRRTRIYFKYSTLNPDSPLFYNDSLIQTAVRFSQETGAKAIVGMTQSGFTAWRLSAHRPKAHMFIFTGNKKLLSIINLIWGVRGFYYTSSESTDATINDIERILIDGGHLKTGDAFITMASMPIHKKYRTNMLKINVVE